MTNTITSQEYLNWIAELKRRYKATQIKAAVSVNSAMIEFYWNLGKDISAKYAEASLGNEFYVRVSSDLKAALPNASGLSPQNLKYCSYFYRLYATSHDSASSPQLADLDDAASPQAVDFAENDTVPQKALNIDSPRFLAQLTLVPWGHHRFIIDKCKGDCAKALFYIRRTIEHGWSRNMLLNMLSTDLYEREGSAQTNFAITLPKPESDLARQLVKDPQVFEVLKLEDEYQEADLKKALVASIEKTLLSFGRGVAFLGSEYPIEVGGEEKQIDLLFYVVPLHRYLIVEVKTGKFEPADLGQLLGYKVMVKHALNTPEDHEPIGLLICRDHNRILAQYMIDELKTPLGITDYEINRILPPVEKLESALSEKEEHE